MSRITALWALPAEQRKAKIRRALADRLSLYLYRILGAWLNPNRTRFALEFRPDSHYEFNRFEDFEPLLQGWLAGNSCNNGGDLSRLYTICLNVSQVLGDGVRGDMVELGVYKGNSASVLAAFARPEKRHVYLFDTFSGFDARDLRGVDGERSPLFSDTSLEGVKRLVGTDGVTYVPGFFPESTANLTLPAAIAVAHIDCDLYQPVKAALECFYPRVSPGGILLLHDYSSGHWPGVRQAVDEFFQKLPEKPILIPDKSGTAIVRKMAG
jgi:hypothetical protein